jgi:hypothetical protein
VTPTVAPVTSLAGATTAGRHRVERRVARRPVILGFAFDGFGIYDNVAMNGATVPVSSLDACNGIFSPVPGYPDGIYHYVLENVKGRPFLDRLLPRHSSRRPTPARCRGRLDVGVAPSAPSRAATGSATAQQPRGQLGARTRFLLDMLRLSGSSSEYC